MDEEIKELDKELGEDIKSKVEPPIEENDFGLPEEANEGDEVNENY